jgi:hypothetical protein
MFYTAMFLAFVKAGYSNVGAKARAMTYELGADPIHVQSLRLHVKHHGGASLVLVNERLCGL